MTAAAAASRAPYPGLRPFRRDETHLFFGREDCINAMVDRLSATHFLAVLGSSGSGKSSLVNTGLQDALELGFMAQAGARWKVATFRPEGAPLRNLARALLRTLEPPPNGEDVDEIEVNRLRARLKREQWSLIDWCNDGRLPKGTSLLLLVDQFEELFRYEDYAGRDEAETFVARLLEIRRPHGVASEEMARFPIYATITMRSEYLGACSLIPGLAEAINEGAFLTPRMTRNECQEAIKGPAEVCGIDIESTLINRILNDLADFASWDDSAASASATGTQDQLSRLARRADQLPLMQHALNQMWVRARERRHGAKIKLELGDYKGLSEELNEHANSVLEELGPERRPIAEAVFRAVTLGTTVGNAVRRPVVFADLVQICGGDRAAVRSVVQAFAEEGCNFLTVTADIPRAEGERDRNIIVDVSHESLIRQWNTLSVWLEKEANAAHEWQRLREDAERGELLTGRRLARSLAWREGRDPNGEREAATDVAHIKPNAAWGRLYGGGDFARVEEFISDSVKADEARRHSRRVRIAAAAAVVVLVLGAAGFGTYAFLQQRAESNLQKAESDLQKAEANSMREQVAIGVTYQRALVAAAQLMDTPFLEIVDDIKKNVQEMEDERRQRIAQEAEKEERQRRRGGQGQGAGVGPDPDGAVTGDPAVPAPTSAAEAGSITAQRWKAWFLTFRGLAKTLTQVRQQDEKGYSNNVGLMRSHTMALALSTFFLDDRKGAEAQQNYRLAEEIAGKLAGRKLDEDGALKFSASFSILAEVMEQEQLFDRALEGRRHSIEVMGSFGLTNLDGFVRPTVNALNRTAAKVPSELRIGYYTTSLVLATRAVAAMTNGLHIHDAYFLCDGILDNLDRSRQERESALAGAEELLARLNDKDAATIVMPANAIAASDLLIFLKGNALKRKAAALRRLDRLEEARADLERAIAGVAGANEPYHTLMLRVSGEVENDLGYILIDLSKQQEEGSARKKEIVTDAVTHFEKAKRSAFRLRIRQYNDTNRELAANRVVRLAGVYRYDVRNHAKARENYELGANLRRWLVISDEEAEVKKYDNAYARRNLGIALRYLGSWEYRYGSKVDGADLHRECAGTLEKLAEDTKRGINEEAVGRCYMGLSTALRRMKKGPLGAPTFAAAAEASRTAIGFLDRAEAGGRPEIPLDTGYYGLASAFTLSGIIGEATDNAWDKHLEYVLRILARTREAYAKDKTISTTDELAEALDKAAFGSLLARKKDDAIRYGDELVTLERPGKRLRENLAHVFTFAGRTNEAKEMYRAMIRLDRGYYEDIKEDYALFRGRGLGLPIMDEIEKELDALCSQMVCLAGTPQ